MINIDRTIRDLAGRLNNFTTIDYILPNSVFNNEINRYLVANNYSFKDLKYSSTIWEGDYIDSPSLSSSIETILTDNGYIPDQLSFTIEENNVLFDNYYNNLFPDFKKFLIHSTGTTSNVYFADFEWGDNTPRIKSVDNQSFSRSNNTKSINNIGNLYDIDSNIPNFTFDFGGANNTDSYINLSRGTYYINGYENYSTNSNFTQSDVYRYGIKGQKVEHGSGLDLNASSSMVVESLNITASNTYSFRMIIKDPSEDEFYIGLSQIGSKCTVNFIDMEIYDENDKVLSYNIEEIEKNSYLIDMVVGAAAQTDIYGQLRGGLTNETVSTEVSVGGTYELYGFQMALSDSYINYGLSQSVSQDRTDQIANMVNIFPQGSSEGSVMLQLAYYGLQQSSSANLFWFTNQASPKYFFALYQNRNNYNIYDYSYNGGTFITIPTVENCFHKIIITWKGNLLKVFFDGKLFTSYRNLTDFDIDSIISTRDGFSTTKLKQFAIGNHLLSDKRGEELTSWNSYENLARDFRYKIYN